MPNERIAIARRVVADRCLYGVDINPMAVEMAKLSLWLITVDANRPFTFLDHAFKCGDSLLGITSLEQLENFSLRPGGGKQQAFATLNLWRHIDEAKKKREELEALPSDTPEQIAAKAALYAEAEEAVAKLNAAADVLVAVELKGLNGNAYESEREASADQMMDYWANGLSELQVYARQKMSGRICLHWTLAFPEIFGRGGFDGFVGNPPFLGGTLASTMLGVGYTSFLHHFFEGWHGKADFVGMFFRRLPHLLSKRGYAGFLSTAALLRGETRASSLEVIVPSIYKIYRGRQPFTWPGSASVSAICLWLSPSNYSGACFLENTEYSYINAALKATSQIKNPSNCYHLQVLFWV